MLTIKYCNKRLTLLCINSGKHTVIYQYELKPASQHIIVLILNGIIIAKRDLMKYIYVWNILQDLDPCEFLYIASYSIAISSARFTLPMS